MKKSHCILAALAGLAFAQDRSDYLPDCSLDCLDKATEKATDCALDDAWCWCIQSNYEAIYNSGVACVLQACGSDKSVDEVLPAAAEFCEAATSSHTGSGAGTTKTEASQAQSTAQHSITSGATTGEATQTTEANPTETDADDAATTSSEGGGTNLQAGPVGGLGMLLFGLAAAF